MPGFWRGVADGVLGRHGALPADGAGAGKDGFEKCRLTAEIGANQCDAAGAAGWLALRLAHDLLPCGYTRGGRLVTRLPAQAFSEAMVTSETASGKSPDSAHLT